MIYFINLYSQNELMLIPNLYNLYNNLCFYFNLSITEKNI